VDKPKHTSGLIDDDYRDIWYVAKGTRVQGPYSVLQIRHYLSIGRLRNNDRVSKDGELWEPVTLVPQMIPEELLNFALPCFEL